MESLGLVKVGTTSFYKLRLWLHDGTSPIVQYHDTTTLLLTRMDQVQVTPQGKLNTLTYFSDWRLTDGIKTAFQMRQKSATIELVLTLARIQNNLPLLESDFTRPAEAPNKPAKVR